MASSGPKTASSTLASAYGNSEGGPEAEISVWRQRPANYEEQDYEREGRQVEQTSPANAGVPAPPDKGLPHQGRSHDHHQECDQEDCVAQSALGSMSRYRVKLHAITQGHCSQGQCRGDNSGLSQSAQAVPARPPKLWETKEQQQE